MQYYRDCETCNGDGTVWSSEEISKGAECTTCKGEGKIKISSANRSVLQDWVCSLTFMQQSVLIAAVRGPDGIRKDHPVKVLCRWLRRSFLLCAFERIAHNDPTEHCGGSFTGKCCTEEVRDINHAFELYLRSVDELPHHFQLHFMHAAQILGYKHPVPSIRLWWLCTYFSIVKDAHLYPESEEIMDKRLGDNESNWRNAEVVTAK